MKRFNYDTGGAGLSITKKRLFHIRATCLSHWMIPKTTISLIPRYFHHYQSPLQFPLTFTMTDFEETQVDLTVVPVDGLNNEIEERQDDKHAENDVLLEPSQIDFPPKKSNKRARSPNVKTILTTKKSKGESKSGESRASDINKMLREEVKSRVAASVGGLVAVLTKYHRHKLLEEIEFESEGFDSKLMEECDEVVRRLGQISASARSSL